MRKRAEPNQKKRRGKASSQSAPPVGPSGGTQASRDNTANDESHSYQLWDGFQFRFVMRVAD